ncbi:AEC family transporter [Massilia sp. W12]|uniref:AEC family transporter n=1 Tax=Massilia sp. W12 TaxID=3126507 RepID=UPI0030D61891
MLIQQILLSAPLFILVFLGYAVMKFANWPASMSENLSRYVFTLALPAMLFHLMSDLSRLPPVDWRLLLAFFGSCLILFALGRLLYWKVFKLDGASQAVCAMCGVFSNNVMLGVPLTKTLLGEQAMPAVALILVFNALVLWTMITASIEISRSGKVKPGDLKMIVWNVVRNPMVGSIVLGCLWGVSGIPLPKVVDDTVQLIGASAAPLALLALGMGLAEYGMGKDWRLPLVISVMKLVAQPLIAWLLCYWLGLGKTETAAVVLLASISIGVNVYLMARQFGAQEGPVASAILISTGLSALSTPWLMSLVGY